ncbi:MAG: ribonuclease R, partial [Rudaea sp.]
MKKKSPAAAKRGKASNKLPGWLPDVANAPQPRQGQPGRGKKTAPAAKGKHDRFPPAARGGQSHAGDRSGRPQQRGAPPPAAAKASGHGPRGTGHHDPHAEREAQRYEHPIPSREVILKYLAERGELLKAEALALGLGLTHERDIEALAKRLGAMLRDGQLLQNRRGGYGAAARLDLIPGTIIANAEGFGFLRPDAGGDDVYISPAEMRKVLHGDRVLLSIVGVDRRGRKQGAIVEVLERRASRLVGRVVMENGVVLVAPDDRRMHQD